MNDLTVLQQLAAPEGPSLDPKRYVARGTQTALICGWFVMIVGGFFIGLVLSLISYGIFLVVAIVGVFVEIFRAKQAYARMRGSALQVGPNQLPELHGIVTTYWKRLGLENPPEVFIVQANQLNAFAIRIGRRRAIVLVDSIVEAGLRSGEAATLNFIIAHELAHHALGHVTWARAKINASYKKLSRLNEFSADAVADALLGQPRISLHAIALLVAGPQVFPLVNLEELRQQVIAVLEDKYSTKAEKHLTHPLLLRRFAALLKPELVRNVA